MVVFSLLPRPQKKKKTACGSGGGAPSRGRPSGEAGREEPEARSRHGRHASAALGCSRASSTLRAYARRETSAIAKAAALTSDSRFDTPRAYPRSTISPSVSILATGHPSSPNLPPPAIAPPGLGKDTLGPADNIDTASPRRVLPPPVCRPRPPPTPWGPYPSLRHDTTGRGSK